MRGPAAARTRNARAFDRRTSLASFSPSSRPQPPTVIFHLSARFKADPFKDKLNLGVGAYRDEELKPVVFSAIRKAEAAVVAAGGDKEYLPIAGLAEFRVRQPAGCGRRVWL